MKLSTFLAVFTTVAVVVPGTIYTVNQVNAKSTAPQTQTEAEAVPTQTENNSQTQQIQAQAESETQFICAESYDAEAQTSLPTTFAWTPRGKIAVIRWQSELAGGWTPEARCNEVSPRFQEAYYNNTLGLITNGTIDNQRVICTANEPGGACNTLLLTLRPEDDSLNILNQFQQIFDGAQVGPIKQNSSVPQIYYQVDVEEFLRTAPVEEE